jgi:hypothetical protein
MPRCPARSHFIRSTGPILTSHLKLIVGDLMSCLSAFGRGAVSASANNTFRSDLFSLADEAVWFQGACVDLNKVLIVDMFV